MKKIGVITYHKAQNYGAYLQCLALQMTLKALNYSESVINYENDTDRDRYKLISIKTPKSLIKSLILYPLNKKRERNFVENQKRLALSSVRSSFDVAIAGSDQIWNANLCGGKLDPYFTLEAVSAIKKISYAASIGDETAIDKYPKQFAEICERLDHISVRETQAEKKLKTITNKPVATVIDPTGLVTKQVWEDLISSIEKDSKPYIFSYFIGIRPDQNRALTKITEKLNLKTTSYSILPVEKNKYRHCYTDGPLQFLARLRDAKLVITSSFHGTILSIILHKNFYVLMPAPKKRSRMDNILSLVGLTGRIIETEADLDKINLEDIDYTEPQKKLDILRQESLDWLKNAIEN